MNLVPAVSEVEPACVPYTQASLLTIFAIYRAIVASNLNMGNRACFRPDLFRSSLVRKNALKRVVFRCMRGICDTCMPFPFKLARDQWCPCMIKGA